MAENRTKKDSGIWGMMDRLEGDKIIWIIVFFLIMISIMAISSSTSLLALQSHSSRLSFAGEQVIIAAMGLGIILFCYKFCSVGVFRFFSKFGFAISFAMLVFLASHFDKISFFKPVKVNEAWRVIQVGGFQLHVFEFTKIFMVMYISWAMDALKTGRTEMADELSKIKYLAFLRKDGAKTVLYVILPIIIIFGLVALGSVSSACFIGLIMGATAFIGGLKWKYILNLGIAGVAGIALIFGIYQVSGHTVFTRLGTATHRIFLASSDPLTRLHECKSGPGSEAFQKILDETMQPVSAKVAVSEGGFFGKGPGKSTQRYKVAIMYEDYMFSFIVEEYGMLGGLLIMLLYGSLLARGSMIVRNCENHYAKTVVSGLVILISGQALMHIFINVDLGPLTGQTLPMISHGNSSFLAFSIAFGVLLSISKMVKKKMEKEAANADPIIVKADEDSEIQED